MDHCCEDKAHEIAQLRGRQLRVLRVVLAINASMLLIEFTAGIFAHSTALMADSVDMLGDAIVYALSLYVIDRGLRWRAGAAVAKGAIILAFGVWILIEAAFKLAEGMVPLAPWMAILGMLALAANPHACGSFRPLRSQDVNMRSTFECSRNDVISNVGVLLAAAGVAISGQSWPDIAIGLIVATLFLRSALSVLREAWPQMTGSIAGALAASPHQADVHGVLDPASVTFASIVHMRTAALRQRALRAAPHAFLEG